MTGGAMLRIRQEQLDAFDRQAADGFEARAVRHFREALPGVVEGLTDDALRARVRSAARRAARYGLVGELDVLLFADASLLAGDEAFDTSPDHPWAGRILTHPTWPPGEKSSRLLRMACDAYNAAADEADPGGGG